MTFVKRLITKSGSEWTPHAIDIFRVTGSVITWEQLFTSITADETHMARIIEILSSKITRKVRQIEKDYIMSLRASGELALVGFYREMGLLVKAKLPKKERALERRPPTPAEVLEHPKDTQFLLRQSQRLQARMANVSVQAEAVALQKPTVPKSSRHDSVSSVLSDQQKSLETTTEKAFASLLTFCLEPLELEPDMPLSLLEDHTKRSIDLRIARSTVCDDGCIRDSRSELAVINLESESREGSSGENMYGNIFAQEFAEILSIMMERLEWTGTTDRTAEAFRTVYSFSIHHRRVYLTRVIFSTPYLEQLQSGKALTEKVVVERSETNLRMDDVEKLRALIGYIIRLLWQLSGEVCNGMFSKESNP